MKKVISGFLLSVLLCAPANAFGLFFTSTTHPLTGTCAIGKPGCLRCGESNSLNILYLFEFGDSGVDAAVKDGCICRIHYIDVTENTFLFLFRKKTTTVYGE